MISFIHILRIKASNLLQQVNWTIKPFKISDKRRTFLCFPSRVITSSALSVSDTDSLSQGSSVGSLGLEDDEDRNSLKNHFETLASGLSEGKHQHLHHCHPLTVTELLT